MIVRLADPILDDALERTSTDGIAHPVFLD